MTEFVGIRPKTYSYLMELKRIPSYLKEQKSVS